MITVLKRKDMISFKNKKNKLSNQKILDRLFFKIKEKFNIKYKIIKTK